LYSQLLEEPGQLLVLKLRQRKTYVQRSELEQIEAQCEARRQFRQNLNGQWQLWRRMATLLREVEQR